MKEVKKKKKKISIQKIFNLISFIFILSCIIFYGTRFIKLYKENNKKEDIAYIKDTIKNNNIEGENFKNINGDYYFYGEEVNNYIMYSNFIWRIISVNTDGTIKLILDNSITALANGSNNKNINNWLNKSDNENTGIFEKALNDPKKYLVTTNTCNDKITDIKKITCKTTTTNTLITTLSINDYVNTGSSNSFLNNHEYYYLINKKNDNNIWYVNDEGKVGLSDGNDIIGIKPVITLKKDIVVSTGNGTKENPYTFEKESSLIGSYVKIDNDIWRIYSGDEEDIKLSLDTYLKINNEEIAYKYSNNSYKHNDTTYGSLAYYLNKTYLNSLKYKNIINEVTYSNGIYNNTNDYAYSSVLEEKIKTKVSLLSIGDIIVNPSITNYYLSTGISKDSNMIYTIQNDFKIYTKVSTSNLKIVPTISIKKNLLEGNGTKESPYEVNYE